MKVILLQDVKSLGKKDAMVEVNEGYARNFIIPKKLGIEATPKNLNDFKLKKAQKEISDALKNQLGKDIDKKKIVMKDSIKAVGSFTVKIKLHPEVQAELSVKVEEA